MEGSLFFHQRIIPPVSKSLILINTGRGVEIIQTSVFNSYHIILNLEQAFMCCVLRKAFSEDAIIWITEVLIMEIELTKAMSVGKI